MVISRTKEQVFGFIKENYQRTVKSWRNKMLSQVGREILLKAITMAMQMYAMSHFKLPVKLCKEINGMMANFWWREENGKRKIHWCSWKKLTGVKDNGGLEFRDLRKFSKALLGKQIAWLLTCPNLLVSKFMKAKYTLKGSIHNCKVKNNASWIWLSLMGAR